MGPGSALWTAPCFRPPDGSFAGLTARAVRSISAQNLHTGTAKLAVASLSPGVCRGTMRNA